MTTVDIAQALVTEPPLIWLVRFTGLAVLFGALPLFVVTTAIEIHRREKP